MKTSGRFFFWFLAISISALTCSSCADTSTPTPSGGSDDSPGSGANGWELNMRVQINVIDDEGGEETESVQDFPDPDGAVIDEKVRSIDWQNTRLRPCVNLGSSIFERINFIQIKGGLGTPNTDGPFRAYWAGEEDGEDGKVSFYRQSPPLDSLDTAIDLLVSFRNDDQKWRTLVQWSDVE